MHTLKMKFLISIFTLNLIVFVQCKEIHRAVEEKVRSLPPESERREVCIEDLGCYPDPDPGATEAPWYTWEGFKAAIGFSNGLDSPMDSRDWIATNFRWWAPGEKKVMVSTHREMNVDGFDPGLKVKFVVHGFQASGDKEWVKEMKDALMRKEQCNVFIVDWKKGAGVFRYSNAAANTWVVGAELGNFIVQLVEKTGLNVADVHIIGHSLGAHISGFAGKWVKNKLQKLVGRITGLDAAGPDFEDEEVWRRLDRSDAEFVDTIHSNAALSITDGFGIVKPIGHFDFYPNGGELQPRCATSMGAVANIASEAAEIIYWWYNMISKIRGDKKDIDDAVEDLSCNHGRAIQFFIKSIGRKSCQFIAEECKSWADYLAGKCHTGAKVHMGYHSENYKKYVDQHASKKFFLITNSNNPSCKKLRSRCRNIKKDSRSCRLNRL